MSKYQKWRLVIIVVVALFYLLRSVTKGHGQTPAYFHDATLDGINVNAVNIDTDLRAGLNGLHNDNTNILANMLSTNSLQDMGAHLAGKLYVGNHAIGNTTLIPPDLTDIMIANTNNLNAVSNSIAALTQGIGFTNVFTGTYTNAPAAPSAALLSLGTFNLGAAYQSQTFSMDFSTNSLSTSNKTVMLLVRGIAIGFIYLTLFLTTLKWLQDSVDKAMNQKQMQGSEQEILGVNISAPSALFFAVVFTAALGACLTLIVAHGFVKTSFLATLQVWPTIQSGMTAIPGWDVAYYIFPSADACAALLSYLGFRYIYGWPLFLLVRTIQKFMLV